MAFNTNFHDKIAKICTEHFNTLPKTGKPNKNEWTILSCIVQENADKNIFTVVALGTGTKCIGQSKMSKNGDILNDSHAEIICRRAFLRYLYEQIDLCFCNTSEIFDLTADKQRNKLKDGVKFHFFTSHVPCGDAAIFPKQDVSEFGQCLPVICNKNSLKRQLGDDDTNSRKQLRHTLQDIDQLDDVDIFRTGAKCLPHEVLQDTRLEGPDYHTTGAVRTKPGRGDPTQSLSCSDKLAKWCYLGVQGAILTLLLEAPVYINTFIMSKNSPYCEEAIHRALFDRFGPVNLEYPYKQNKIILGQSSLDFKFSKKPDKSPCPSSIIWCKTNYRPLEVAVDGRKQGVTKKNQCTEKGRLSISKKELFRMFLGIVHRQKLKLIPDEVTSVNYRYIKTSAAEYQMNWDMVKSRAFRVWANKDRSLLDFYID